MEDCFPNVADNAFRAVIENMAQGAVILTADGLILYANRSFSEMAKSPLEDLIGASIYDFIPVESRTTLRTILQKDGKAELFLVSEGERRPVCASALQISEMKGAKCLIVTDLTEQKRNDAIVAAERLAGSILERAVEGIVVCDHSGKILHCSLAAAEICGQDPTLQSFDDVFDLRLSNEEGTGKRISPISAYIQGNILSRVEVCLKRKDGKQFLLLLNAGPVKNEGAVIGCVVALSDITELKNAKDNLARARLLPQKGSPDPSSSRLWKASWSAIIPERSYIAVLLLRKSAARTLLFKALMMSSTSGYLTKRAQVKGYLRSQPPSRATSCSELRSA